jgi:hypothetical protein
MGAIRKRIKHSNEYNRPEMRKSNIIELMPHLLRKKRNDRIRNLLGKEASIHESPAEPLSASHNPSTTEIIVEIVHYMDEKAREEEIRAAFARADKEYDEENTVIGHTPEFTRKTTPPIPRRLRVMDRYEREKTNRVFALTGRFDGNLQDVLNWDV